MWSGMKLSWFQVNNLLFCFLILVKQVLGQMSRVSQRDGAWPWPPGLLVSEAASIHCEVPGHCGITKGEESRGQPGRLPEGGTSSKFSIFFSSNPLYFLSPKKSKRNLDLQCMNKSLHMCRKFIHTLKNELHRKAPSLFTMCGSPFSK